MPDKRKKKYKEEPIDDEDRRKLIFINAYDNLCQYYKMIVIQITPEDPNDYHPFAAVDISEDDIYLHKQIEEMRIERLRRIANPPK